MCVYDPASSLLFSSKLFSAHVGEPDAGSSATYDDGGWEKFGRDWSFFYECMFAPVAKQTAVALDRLDVDVVPMGPLQLAPKEAPKPNKLARGVGKVVRALFPQLAEELVAGPAPAAGAAVAATGGKMQVSVICPLHGPIIRTSTSEMLREYREWTDKQLAATRNGSVAIIYASAYGNTAALAQARSER
jgi:flavorubredoxin